MQIKIKKCKINFTLHFIKIINLNVKILTIFMCQIGKLKNYKIFRNKKFDRIIF